MKMPWFQREHRYSLISEGKRSPLFAAILYWSAIISVIFISFVLGRRSVISQPDGGDTAVLKLGTMVKSFQYNRTFSEAPSNRTDQAWRDLFPHHGGFFSHPEVSPQRATFSVYHQLHCLNGIREGYWMLYHAATTKQEIAEEDFPMMASPAHIRHCIDLLRQSLMCYADTALEMKEKDLNGVKGWGTEHQCRDYDELVQWTIDAQSIPRVQ